MYKYLLIASFTFLLLGFGFGQDTQSTSSQTKLVIHPIAKQKIEQWGLNDTQNARLFTTPKFINFYNYYFTASFQIKDGQIFNVSDMALINIEVYEELRHETNSVEVYDELTGTILILDSHQKMMQKQIEYGIIDPSITEESKVCTNCD